MNALLRMGAVLSSALAVSAAAGPARAQAAASAPAGMRPPMNDFDQAFYRCDEGVSVMLTYDSDQPEAAQMTTNADSRHYALKRTTAPSGVAFTGGGARFWTDGKTVAVEAAKANFHNCKLKGG